MMTTIYLNGPLGKTYGRKWRLDINTPHEIVDAIDAGKQGFRRAYLDLPGYVYRVRVGRKAIRRGEEHRLDIKHGSKTISITPVLEAHANTKGIVTTILGVALFVVGIVVPGAQFLAAAGLSLTLSGIAMLLSPVPRTTGTTATKNKPSYQFSGPINTVVQGGCVPVLLGGPLWIGSGVVSEGIFSKDITQGSSGDGHSGGGGNSNQGQDAPAIPAYQQHDSAEG